MVARDLLAVAAFVAATGGGVALVVAKARTDSVDPARCKGLVALGNRCCAEGQTLDRGRCTGRPSRCPVPLVAGEGGCSAPRVRVALAGGLLHVGAGDWEAEGRIRPHEAQVPAFELDAFEITESAYGECVEAGACAAVGLTGEPGRALGHLTRANVEAYCAFRGGRLPTEDEWTFAAAGPTSRRYPWGDTGAVCRRGVWGLNEGPCGYGFVGPELAGGHPDGATPEGVYDLAGNVAEWVTEPLATTTLAIERIGSAGGAAPGLVRGGSFRTSLATNLRTWHGRRAAAVERSAEIGGRCAYDPEPSLPTP